jgi:uncharacterized damage-inducible protein DinB
MPIAQSLIPEFQHEVALTLKTLSCLPAGKYEWAPHTKSMTVRQLASHMATIPTWGTMTLSTESFDINPPGAPPFVAPSFGTTAEVLAGFEKAAGDFSAALARADDAAMMAPWSLMNGGKTMFTMPRVAVLRGMIMNHLVHHRGQLSVYLRLLDVPVPAIYGPSADEQS